MEFAADADRDPRTQILRDASRTLIAYNDSPDVPFDASINPYRGCEHGCTYCYARPTHEFLGFSAGLDFETLIVAKFDAGEILRRELSAPKWRPRTVALSGVTDPYQPIESDLRITRDCLEVLAEFRNPVGVVTKNAMVTRDLDLLGELAAHDAACVHMSITTLDPELARDMEPRTSHPQRRLDALRQIADAGIPCGVLVAPVIPGLNDHEIPAILEACARAGARSAGYVMLRLPGAVGDVFEEWLTRRSPERARKVAQRIRELRGGARNDSKFGTRMRGEGPHAAATEAAFRSARRRCGLAARADRLSAASFRPPGQTLLPWGS